jgi:hypothetical protein
MYDVAASRRNVSSVLSGVRNRVFMLSNFNIM